MLRIDKKRTGRLALAAVACVGIASTLHVGTALADSTTVTTGVAGGASRTINFDNPPFLGSWSLFSFCDVGVQTFGGLGGLESRCAIEFPLAALPADATITNVTLFVNSANANVAKPAAVAGYAGDGAISLADFDVTSPSVAYTHVVNPGVNPVDITSLMTDAVRTAGWLGVNIRVEPLLNENSLYPLGTFETNRAPSLAITYTLPATTTTTVPATTTVPDTTTVPASTTTQAATTTSSAEQLGLPATGSRNTPVLAVAAILLAAGALVTMTTRRSHRPS